jgi:hypothetical protein
LEDLRGGCGFETLEAWYLIGKQTRRFMSSFFATLEMCCSSQTAQDSLNSSDGNSPLSTRVFQRHYSSVGSRLLWRKYATVRHTIQQWTFTLWVWAGCTLYCVEKHLFGWIKNSPGWCFIHMWKISRTKDLVEITCKSWSGKENIVPQALRDKVDLSVGSTTPGGEAFSSLLLLAL